MEGGCSETQLHQPAQRTSTRSQQPNSTEHDDHTSRGDTTLSSRGWLHVVGGTPSRNTRSEAAPLKPSVLVNEDGCGKLVKKAGYNWLCRLVTSADYGDWLHWLVTTIGYVSWLRRPVKVIMNWSAWRGEDRSRDEDRTIWNDEGTRWRDRRDVTMLQDDKVTDKQLNGWNKDKGPATKVLIVRLIIIILKEICIAR